MVAHRDKPSVAVGILDRLHALEQRRVLWVIGVFAELSSQLRTIGRVFGVNGIEAGLRKHGSTDIDRVAICKSVGLDGMTCT